MNKAWPESVAEFERRFVVRARRYLAEPWSGTDFRANRTTRKKLTWWGWFSAEEVLTRGSFPHTELLVIGTGDHDTSCRFGFAIPIWFDEGRASWDPTTGWKPDWAEDAATMLCYNTFEEAEWTVGVPTRPPCQPDVNGVTWIDLQLD